jgi:dihydroxyacetone kinase-like protein
VSNLLAAAKHAGVYRITFDRDIFEQMAVVETLKQRFGLNDLLVVPSVGTIAEQRARVASAGAFYVAGSLNDCTSLGIAWGQTVLELGDALEPTETKVAKVCQMVGIARTQLWKLAEACNSRIAHALGADVMQFPAPGLVSTRELFEDLSAEPIVAEQFAALRSVDAAVFGICSTKPDSPFFASGLVQGLSSDILSKRAVAGIIGGRMYDNEGQSVTVEGYDDRLLAMTFDEIKGIPRRFGVAAGLEKIDAIEGALRGGLLTALAVDFDTACAIAERG